MTFFNLHSWSHAHQSASVKVALCSQSLPTCHICGGTSYAHQAVRCSVPGGDARKTKLIWFRTLHLVKVLVTVSQAGVPSTAACDNNSSAPTHVLRLQGLCMLAYIKLPGQFEAPCVTQVFSTFWRDAQGTGSFHGRIRLFHIAGAMLCLWNRWPMHYSALAVDAVETKLVWFMTLHLVKVIVTALQAGAHPPSKCNTQCLHGLCTLAYIIVPHSWRYA